MCEPPMCTLKELEDGTYSITDVAKMIDIIDFKTYMQRGR